MRILFIAPYVPSLIRVRPYNWIRFLALQGHKITLVALGTDGPERDRDAESALAPFCEAIHVVPHFRKRAAWQCALSLPTPTPLWAAYCHSPALEAVLRKLADTQTFDVAHIEHLRAAHFARALPTRLPVVYDAVDCITDLQGQLRRAPGRSLLSRFISWEEEKKLRRYEPRAAARCTRTVITSQSDADALQALARPLGLHFPIDVIPNGVDLDYFQPPPAAQADPQNVIFSGKMSYAANDDAAQYFAAQIWPRVRRACPQATFTIAGSGPRAALRAVAARPGSGIHVTGYAADLRPLLARASVAVCPLRIGVGIQNKVLEAMAMGLAVVATPLAARALQDDVPGRALCVADTPEEFAGCVTDLLAQPAEIIRVGAEARRYVQTHHDWNRLALQLTHSYQRAQEDTQKTPAQATNV